MLSIPRESLGLGGSDVRELDEPCGEVVQACRSCDAASCIVDCKRILRVLVVDDNHDCADSLSMLVNLWGDKAQTAYDGAAALALTALRRPDVVLLDLAMPKMDGCQVARRLREQTAFGDTLLIAITGYTNQAHRQLCSEAGFDHYLIKPVDLADLEKLLLDERARQTRLADEPELREEVLT
jgi:CheY-like chemotaxis protein